MMKPTSSSTRLRVLIGACLFQCALLGVLTNSSSVLFAHIRQELNLSLTQVSTYHTIKGIAGALGGAALTSLFFRLKKPVFMGIMLLVVTLSFAVLIPGAQYPWVWWVGGALTGLSTCTSSVMLPFVLAQRFPDQPGTVTGIAMAFSGLGGMAFSPLCARLITAAGWQNATWIFSAITLLMGGAALLLLFAGTGGDGESASPQTGGREKQALASGFPVKKFLLCCTALMSSWFVLQFCNYVTMFAQDAGYSLHVGARLASVLMVGNVCGKLIFGYACDRMGVYRSMILTLSGIGLGGLLMVLFPHSIGILYLAMLLYGQVYGLAVISVSRCTMQTYGNEQATRYMGLHTSINSGLQAVSSIGVGQLYDHTGSFNAQLLLGIWLIACSIGACLTLSAMKRRALALR